MMRSTLHELTLFSVVQVIVLGNQSSGKSSLLERLSGCPVFPRAQGISTRCVVRVLCRRSVENKA